MPHQRPLVLLAVVVAAGCGGGDEDVVTVDEARKSAGRILRVSGYLFGFDGEVMICTGLSDASPPRCMEPSLKVEGVRPSTLGTVRSARGATWTQDSVNFLGEVSDGKLRRVGKA